jgi:nicotinate-nucleotide adenylyltransferase
MLNLFYGGTFDPVHNGHLAIALAARDALRTEVRLMPAGDPPHRQPPGAAAAQRARMLELAIAGEAGLRVDRRELRRHGRSYTIDTLRDVRAELGPKRPLALLVGADSFRGLPTWHEWRALFEVTHFVVAQRPGSPLDAALPDELADLLHGRWADDAQTLRDSPAGSVFRLDQPLHAESASEVRRLIAAGAPWRHLVPRAVADFIAEKGLYARPGVQGSL